MESPPKLARSSETLLAQKKSHSRKPSRSYTVRWTTEVGVLLDLVDDLCADADADAT